MEKQKVFKFALVGISVSIFDFVVYSIAAGVFFSNALWIATAISGVLATTLTYILHSNITWKAKDPGKFGVIKFFIWNGIAVLIIRPILAFLLEKLDGLYQFALGICNGIGLPFDYNFVKNTGVWVLSVLVVMVLNFLVYDRLIFGKDKVEKRGEKKNVKGVRQPRKEQNRKRVR